MNTYEELRQFMAGYLHEDFRDEYASPWEAVDDFVRGNGIWAESVPDQIRSLLAAFSTEQELGSVVHRAYGSRYLPGADGWSYRGWLLAIAARIEYPLGPGTPSEAT